MFNTGGVGTKQEYGCGLVAALSDHQKFSTVLDRAINRGSIMKCDRCNGQGFSVIAKWKCPVCDGTGKVVHPMMSMNGDEYTGEWEQHECEACNGTGEIQQTNFENITKNEGALAKWLSEKIHFCRFVSCDECTEYVSEDECKDVTNAELWSAWLKQTHTIKE